MVRIPLQARRRAQHVNQALTVLMESKRRVRLARIPMQENQLAPVSLNARWVSSALVDSEQLVQLVRFLK